MPSLIIRVSWIMCGFFGLFILLLLTFVLVPPFIGFANEDVLAHFAAYFITTLWFLMVCLSRKERYLVVISLLILGIISEILQPLSPYHIFDWRDVMANMSGVLLAAFVPTSRAQKVLRIC